MNIEELRKRADNGDHAAVMELARQLDLAEKPVETIAVLSKAASQGNIQARFMVAVRLLIGYHVPVRPPDALRLLSECVQHGHADAATLLAAIVGIGAYTPQDLPRAADLLQFAAERGSKHAQQQLIVLAGDRQMAEQVRRSAVGPSVWKGLRASVDTDSWSLPLAVETLSQSPRIGKCRDLVSKDVCNWMIGRSQGRLVRAEVYNSARHITQVDETRTNTTAIFDLLQTDLVSVYVQMRMAAASGMPFNHMEAAAVLHYAVGERITDHFDFIDPRTADYEEQIRTNGQRSVTFLLYLNEDYGGGETVFPRLSISHKGKTGDGLFFFNADEAGQADVRTAHAGNPPTSGEKWIVSQFVRNRPATPGAAHPH